MKRLSFIDQGFSKTNRHLFTKHPPKPRSIYPAESYFLDPEDLELVQRIVAGDIQQITDEVNTSVPGQPVWTYREIAEELGLSPTRVQQIERRALRKMRNILGSIKK